MAEQDQIRVARENIEAFNAGDWARVKSTMTANSIYQEFATGRRLEGADNVLEADKEWKKAFPDAKGTVNNVVSGGNSVTLEVTWGGTQTGPLDGPSGSMPASGKPVLINAALVMTFEGDKIKEAHHYFDMMGMLQQLGAIPGA